MSTKREFDNRMSPKQIFDRILRTYFYHTLPMPLDVYLSVIEKKPAHVRRTVARSCHDPEIIEALVNDPDPAVSQEAQRNEYWRLLGQYKPLLGLSQSEKIDFIRREGFPNILVFLVFETDLKVLEELFQHPGISVNMLNSLRHYFLEKDEPNVQPVQQLIKDAITVRRRRILQVSSVFKEARADEGKQSISRILPFLLDNDEVVVKSAVNVLKHYDYTVLKSLIFEDNPLQDSPPDNERIWLVLHKLQKYYKLSDKPFLKLSGSPLNIRYTQQSFLDDIYERKSKLLDYCYDNLHYTQNLVVLAHAHLDTDPNIRNKLIGILNIEELLSLISDPTFPQGISYRIIEILKKHSSNYVQKRISEIFLELYERTRARMREMELTVNAYFDIIFNSLGYPHIHQLRHAFKILDAAKKLTSNFIDHNQRNTKDIDGIFNLFGKIAEFYQEKLSKLYFDMAESRVQEMEEVYEILLMIVDIPLEFIDKEGYVKEENPNLYYRTLNSTRTIWRSTLGQYLGRLRELDEMIRRKWIYIISDKEQKKLLWKEMKQAIQDLETDYKKEIGCKLQISCLNCQKRPCASERYLRQAEFFLSELLDYVESGNNTEEIKAADSNYLINRKAS